MAVQLQPAEIELRIVTDEAERQLATFRDKVKMEGEVGEFQAGEGAGQAPQKVVDKLKAEAQAKTSEEQKSWGQRDAFFQKFAKGTPPRVHTEIASWAKDRVWDGIDYVHGRRVVESAGNMISGLTKTLETGRLTAITDRAMLSMAPLLTDRLGAMDDKTARRIVGAARVGVEVARWAAKYGSGERTDTHAAVNASMKRSLGEYKDPDTGEPMHDASMISKMTSDVLGGFDFSREGIINSEAGMKASLQTLSQMTNMGMAMVKGGLGEQIVGLDIGDWMGEYATRTYDWNKLQEKMRTEAEIAGTRAFIGHVGGVILDSIGLGGTQLE